MMRHALSVALYVLACALLVGSLLMLLLVVTLLFAGVALTLGITPLAIEITRAIPASLAMFGVVASPFGGVFRTDFLIVAVVLLVAAKIAHRLAKGLS
ncbi:MAG: hypothetical protein KHY83_01220 [Coriobacteriia bacterium]|nr:hypothetical protein [Coriobacteriia bacterium]MBS5477271.1 hypothetical protein [Coriobacteriia bacterium]